MVRTEETREKLLAAFKNCNKSENPSLCRDKVLAKFLAERTISEAVVDILKTNIDTINEGTAIAKKFEENILPSMKEFNNNFTEFMAQHGVRIKSIDGAVKTLSNDMDKRFDKVDKRFEKVDKRFDKLDHKFNKFGNAVGKICDKMDIDCGLNKDNE